MISLSLSVWLGHDTKLGHASDQGGSFDLQHIRGLGNAAFAQFQSRLNHFPFNAIHRRPEINGSLFQKDLSQILNFRRFI